ncbi:MAG: cytosine permease [Actinomycetota bacterium]|nr:cytosine permease [Actinomycetota bacterium]
MSTLEHDAAWGIRPVPLEERRLSAVDMAVLWGDLGIGLLVLVTGGLLVPGLGFSAAFTAIVLGSLIGVLLLAMPAAIGAQHGVPTMVLLRPVLGIRGSWIASALNIVQLIGWTAVELWAMSFVADLVASRVFGFSARPLWLAISALTCTGLALWGPVGVTRVWMEKFGAWVIGGISLAVTVVVLTSDGIGAALSAVGVGGFPTFGPALDLVIAIPVSWFPLVADYTRFGSRPRSAFFGTFWGYLVANVWLYALGALLVLTAEASPTPGGIALGIITIGGGSIVGVLFLVGLLAGETDEAFANIYSGAVTLQNVFPRLSQRGLVVAVGLVGTALAAVLTMELYESFLFLIGSVFVPLLGVLAADHFVVRRGRVHVPDLYDRRGRYWFTGGIRVAAAVPWLGGFIVYHWINPSPLGWWLSFNQTVFGEPLAARLPWLNASVPSFLIAFVLGAIMLRDISSSSTRSER